MGGQEEGGRGGEGGGGKRDVRDLGGGVKASLGGGGWVGKRRG